MARFRRRPLVVATNQPCIQPYWRSALILMITVLKHQQGLVYMALLSYPCLETNQVDQLKRARRTKVEELDI